MIMQVLLEKQCTYSAAMNCIICSSVIEKRFKVYDDRYGYQGIFDLFKCRSCGHNFIVTEFISDQLVRLYSDYYPRSTFDIERFVPAKESSGFFAWLDGAKRSAYTWVPENVRVLDIGCGFGENLAYHKERGCDVYGVEADENVSRIAEKYGFNVHIGLFDPDMYQAGFFDFVTLDQVIEHVVDPQATLSGIARVLKSGGMAILSTPNANGWGARLFGRRWINWHAPYHLQHFSEESMRIVTDLAGLKIERIQTLTSSDWLYFQWIHLLTFPGMGEVSPFWSPRVTQGVKTRLMMKMPSVLHLCKINHLITRLFDALGIGDNKLYFLRKQ